MVKKVDVSGNGHLKNETPVQNVQITPLQESFTIENTESDGIFHLPHSNVTVPDITQQENYYLPQNTINQYCCQGCKDNALKAKEDRKTQKKRHGSLYTDFEINFPINDSTDLEKFEDILKQEEHFDAAVIELAKLGGENKYNFVKRVMSSLLSNEKATEFSWLGRKGKRPFHNLLMAKLVLNAAEKAHEAKDQKETENSLQSWLEQARERRQQSSSKRI
ncbi:unnamed protein product [Phaedon cochleariae]|uniref:DUF4806 domain-containing protein n=1 Tax=Phaedon cochleariae TaxID=80249 RepID=A0A9N9WYL5_PHACE|nr:unnamed protein product [Phaedon cochleariae]